MLLNEVVRRFNNQLAGELFTFAEIKDHLDSVVDDINSKLNSNFPTFSEFQESYVGEPDYNFFPDRYIRSVVVMGAAFYFFITDEEGAEVAPKYDYRYRDNIFLMERDYSDKVPLEYQAGDQGSLNNTSTYGIPEYYDDMF